MYVPKPFVVDDTATLAEFIRANSFATVVSQAESEPFASHLPLLFEEQAEGDGQLTGHMAKANRQWSHADGQTVLCIFHGPHAYISPSWYQAENVVPTWNYAAVHAYGTLRIVSDPEALREIVHQYVAFYEATMPTPWSLDSQDPSFIEKLTEAIVGFTISIERLEGKWKLSQNHSTERRQQVVDGLSDRSDGQDLKVAKLMRANLARQDV